MQKSHLFIPNSRNLKYNKHEDTGIRVINQPFNRYTPNTKRKQTKRKIDRYHRSNSYSFNHNTHLFIHPQIHKPTTAYRHPRIELIHRQHAKSQQLAHYKKEDA